MDPLRRVDICPPVHDYLERVAAYNNTYVDAYNRALAAFKENGTSESDTRLLELTKKRETASLHYEDMLTRYGSYLGTADCREFGWWTRRKLRIGEAYALWTTTHAMLKDTLDAYYEFVDADCAMTARAARLKAADNEREMHKHRMDHIRSAAVGARAGLGAVEKRAREAVEGA